MIKIIIFGANNISTLVSNLKVINNSLQKAYTFILYFSRCSIITFYYF
jgi:hypothetical protein